MFWRSLRVVFYPTRQFLRGAFYPVGQSLRDESYLPGQSLRGAFYPVGQSHRIEEIILIFKKTFFSFYQVVLKERAMIGQITIQKSFFSSNNISRQHLKI